MLYSAVDELAAAELQKLREPLDTSESEPAPKTFASLSIAELIDHVANPSVHSGGATTAAMVGAAAAGVALLVMRVSVRRKSNQPVRQQIDADITTSQALIGKLQAAADHDVEVLDDLMEAYAARRGEGGSERYQAGLRTAAESTLVIADLIVELLEIIARQLPYASRFIVSDLGAAAALAGGAGNAALITARINIELIDERGPAAGSISELHSRLESLTERISTLAASTMAATDAAITRPQPTKGT